MERLKLELQSIKRKFLRDKRAHDEDRKKLAKLLLGMGEKISTNDMDNVNVSASVARRRAPQS